MLGPFKIAQLSVVMLLMTFGHFTSRAQNIADHVRLTGQPDWVKDYPVPQYDLSDYSDRDSYYEIIDWQDKMDTDREAEFVRYAEVMNTPRGVENNSNVSISFDPSYENIDFHYVKIKRGGEYIDKTDLSEFRIYRKETERTKLLFNGTMEISYIVPDVRVGDTIEVAYTRHGRNPILGEHFSHGYQQAYNSVVLRHIQRVIIDQSIDIKTAGYSDAKPPEITKTGNYQEYFWDNRVPEPVFSDSDTPSWYHNYPKYYLSTFKTWEEVGKFYAPYYEPPKKLPEDLDLIRKSILKEHKNDTDRTRAALDFVQSNIRYFGINIGAGGYQPRDVDRIMTRRYGDCKDMTYTLVSLLRAMNIDAKPLLVNSGNDEILRKNLPRYDAFNHVVVRVKLGRKHYVLDPTLGEQIGNLDHLYQGGYRDGVIVGKKSPGRIDLTDTAPPFLEDFHDNFDLVSAAPDIIYTSTSTYHQAAADRIVRWLKSDGLEAIEREYLEFYQNTYSTLEKSGDLSVKMDEELGIASISVKYLIKDPWEPDEDDGEKYFSAYAKDIDGDVPNHVGADRTSPYKIKHPVRTRQVLEFDIDSNWSFEPDELEIEKDAFFFSFDGTVTPKTYKETYIYRSQQDHITSEKFQETEEEEEEGLVKSFIDLLLGE